MDWQFIEPITHNNSTDQPKTPDERNNHIYHHYLKQPYEPRNPITNPSYDPYVTPNPFYSTPNRSYSTPNRSYSTSNRSYDPYVTPNRSYSTPNRSYSTSNPLYYPRHHPQPKPYGEPYPSLYSRDINIDPPRPQPMEHPTYHGYHRSPTPPYHLRSSGSSQKHETVDSNSNLKEFISKQIKESIEETVGTNPPPNKEHITAVSTADDDLIVLSRKSKPIKLLKRKNDQPSPPKLPADFNRFLIYKCIDEQTASSLSLAKEGVLTKKGMHHSIILSRLKYWQKQGVVRACGRNGFQLVEELLIDNIDVNQSFIKELIDEYGPFSWQTEPTPEPTPEPIQLLSKKANISENIVHMPQKSINTDPIHSKQPPHKVTVHPQLLHYLAENDITDIKSFIKAQQQQFHEQQKKININNDNHNHNIKKNIQKEDSIEQIMNPKVEKDATPPNTIKKAKK